MTRPLMEYVRMRKHMQELARGVNPTRIVAMRTRPFERNFLRSYLIIF